MKLPRISITLLLPALALNANAITVEGASEAPVEIKADASTGLDAVLVVSSTDGIRLVHNASSANASVQWYRFSRLGGAYAEEIASSTDGTSSWVAPTPEDMGYIVEEAGRRTCVWLVNYANHNLRLETVAPAAEQDCDRTLLDFAGNASEIPYFTINGRRMVLSRELTVDYSSLSFSDESFAYVPAETELTLESVAAAFSVQAPLCNTTFRLSGDRFLRTWNRTESIESPLFTTTAVDVRTRATQTARDNDNEQRSDSESLGGSAPCEIEFEAAVTDAAIFTEWQISRNPDFDILENSFNDLNINYTFRDNGNTYIRFVANNADGTCEQISDVYTVFIGESRLDIPNAFSPEGSPGVNDEWKVSYRSLVKYECHIFSRSGKELFASTDPGQGWDGKVGGRTVPSGVYFYVIEAVGSDGIRYKRAGDINVINYRSEVRTSEIE